MLLVDSLEKCINRNRFTSKLVVKNITDNIFITSRSG